MKLNFKKIAVIAITVCSLVCNMISPAYATSEQSYSATRASQGDYTATLESMVVRRLSAYGILDQQVDVNAIPDRLDAALLLYRACGTKPKEPCPFTDVPAEYADATTWLYEIGATKGCGNNEYGSGELAEESFQAIISRMLNWGTDDADIISYVMQKRGLAPVVENPDAFTNSEMYQTICSLMDYAYPDHCVPVGEYEQTPNTISIVAGSFGEAERQLRQAMSYLPKTIDVQFTDDCPAEDIERFHELISPKNGELMMPMTMLTKTKGTKAYSVKTPSDRRCLITIRNYSEACEATASTKNWLKVFQDSNYADNLFNFYLTEVAPLRELSETSRITKCHEILCRFASYDTDERNAVVENKTTVNPDAHSIVGFVKNGVIVCDGYANTYSWMLTQLGIDNYVVIGTANGNGHAWNKVKHGISWYNVDTCSNDSKGAQRLSTLKSDKWMTDHNYSFQDVYSCSVFKSEKDFRTVPVSGSSRGTFVMGYSGDGTPILIFDNDEMSTTQG